MSAEAIGWAFRRVTMDDPTAKLVLVGLCNYANDEDQAWPSHATLAKITGLSRSSVQASIKKLEGWGIIKRVQRDRENGSQTSAKVSIDLDSRWTVKGGKAVPSQGGIPAPGIGGAQQPVQGISAPGPLEPSLNLHSESEDGAEAPLKDLFPPRIIPPSEEKSYFDRSKEILGPKGNGLAAKLLKSQNRVIAKARAVIETSSTKSDAAAYIGAVIRGGDRSDMGAQQSPGYGDDWW